MPPLFRAILAGLAWVTIMGAPVSGAIAADCHQDALDRIRASAPNGYAVFQSVGDKTFFFNWIDCDDAQLGLPTAVHESVHYVTAETDAFPLVGGGAVGRPHEVSRFFAPSRIAGRFGASDYVSTYLRRGSASSATDFLYLLDELNAYTHDLDTAVALNAMRSAKQEVSHRDGLAALMAFVAVYVQMAEETEPATWGGLMKPEVAGVASRLWSHAETVMASSCGIPGFGTEDRTYLRVVCSAKPRSSLRTLLGRSPVCPMACLDGALQTAVGR